MSYLVLARKYRPRTFKEVEGQDHTVRALTNALDHDRLHHAYVFSGTRGVGKTTIGRILANCLNCEQGITSTPCGECDSCVAFRDGNFLDLHEVDAASRTGVDDMREMLEGASLRPAMGRFRVYLIDEVQMLSTSSFNALLKTLEEPPEHVKFILATTEPKKIPVTVMSRCLQFHLRNIPPQEVVPLLTRVLEREEIQSEVEALEIIGRAADGSLRDALSITDQAISHGGGSITVESVSEMLGTTRTDEISRILELIVAGDRNKVLEFVDGLAERAVNYPDLIASLQRAIHAMSLFHVSGKIVDEKLVPHAKQLSPEWLQVAYQILLIGMRDIRYAPDHRTGFDMTMLRLLDFEPVAAYPTMEPTSSSTPQETETPQGSSLEPNSAPPVPETQTQPDPEQPPTTAETLEPKNSSESSQESVAEDSQSDLSSFGDLPWHEVVQQVDLPSDVRLQLKHTELVSSNGTEVRLRTNPTNESFWSDKTEVLDVALKSKFGKVFTTEFDFQTPQTETPFQRSERLRHEHERNEQNRREQVRKERDARLQAAREELEVDPFVQTLKREFGVRITDIRLTGSESLRLGIKIQRLCLASVNTLT